MLEQQVIFDRFIVFEKSAVSWFQEALGDIVYVELPDVGKKLSAGDTAGAVESVKAASDIYSPISGTVTEKNSDVENNPSLINKSSMDEGLIVCIN